MTTLHPARGEVVKPSRRRPLDHPLSAYVMLLGATLLLLLLGLVMVLSASSVLSLRTTGSAYTLAERQTLFAAIGLPLMFLASRLPVSFYRRLAWPLLFFALVGLVAVLIPGIGVNARGHQNWIPIFGPFRLQPSEFAKLALVVWTADLLARKQSIMNQWKHLLIPLVPVSLLVVGLILLEGDLGTTLVVLPIILVLLFVAGAPGRLFAVAGVGVVAMVALMAYEKPYRMRRLTAFLHPSQDPSGASYQVLHGWYSLANGGWFGVGLGASREKWGALPEAHTDFIFAVVGEELGLIGTFLVLLLFAILGFAAIRLALRTEDVFVRLASAGVMAWLLFQAFINIGAVLRLLPSTGVPLPLVSYGGSSLIPTMLALGMLMSFARHEPSAQAAISAHRGRG